MTSIETKREWRFYVCLLMGFSLMVGGFFSPPLGEINNSIIVASGILLCLGAMCVGIDLKGIIHELRMFRNESMQPVERKDEE